MDHTYTPQWNVVWSAKHDVDSSDSDGRVHNINAGGSTELTVTARSDGDEMSQFFQMDACEVECVPFNAVKASKLTKHDNRCIINLMFPEKIVSKQVDIILNHPQMVGTHSLRVNIGPAINGPLTFILSGNGPTETVPAAENSRIALFETDQDTSKFKI